jgi:hypothetical protein
LMHTTNERNRKPSVQSPKRNLITGFESQDATVISNRASRSKFGSFCRLRFVTVGNFRNRTMVCNWQLPLH